MILSDIIVPVHEPSAWSDAAYAPTVDISVAVEAFLREPRSCAPGEPVSLWDMLRIYAKDFVGILKVLPRIEEGVKYLEDDLAGKVPGQVEFDDSYKGFWEVAGPFLDEIAAVCTRMQLLFSLKQVGRIREQFGNKPQIFESLATAINELGKRIVDELDGRMFFFAPHELVKYYKDEPLFGEQVAKKLPKQTEDIAEAGKCMAFGRYTAAVFHLMRVMEAAISRLAKILRLRINLDRSWGRILGDISRAIAQLPGAPGVQTGTPQETVRYERLSEVAAYLNHVKDAWRNTTMHPKRTYTQDEAESICNNVGMFMRSLVKLR